MGRMASLPPLRCGLSVLSVEVPEALEPLLQPARYKAAYGGRGGAKSHFFAEQLILRCFSRKTRAACIREVQATIKDSVRQLLIDKIQKLGLGKFFDVLDGEIRGRNGSLIIFKGMQTYNAENIKSLEDFDIAWVEEAQTFSEKSLRLLRPTIRKEGSEIWFSWNPRHDTDAVDKFFRGGNVPRNSIICPVNWYDNPWFGGVLTDEKDQDYANDEEMAEHVWGGGYELITEGAYYAKHIAAAEKSGRVGYFPYDPSLPVYTSWDLGVDDYTAIWFFQIHYTPAGPRIRIIDYYEASGLGADDILAEALPEYTKDMQDRIAALVELGRESPYKYGRHFFPHDIGNREWGAGAKTRIQTVNALGVPLELIHRGVAQDPQERINASRRILPMCEFHQSKRVMLGMSRLRRYSRKKNEALGTYVGILHDENSHGADAFGEFAINCGINPPKPEPAKPVTPPPGKVIAPPVHEPANGRIRI
jgi:phage terminase large subunit